MRAADFARLLDVAKTVPHRGLGWAIRKVRKGQKLTLTEVALEIGSDAANLSRMERGQQEITEPTLLRLAAVFKLRVSDIWRLAETVDQDAEDSGQLLALSGLLSEEQRDRLLDFGNYLKAQHD
jgi:transcriptional regulator with XRE-family HTH domain